MKNWVDLDRLGPMEKRITRRKVQFWGITLLSFFFLFSDFSAGESSEPPSPFRPLICRLSEDGFDSASMSNLLTDARAELNPSLMTISLESKETEYLYAPFLRPEAILLSKKFLQQNLKTLRRAENRFHVEKEIIVAILLVESRFGENIGRFRVVPTLASIALMASPEHLQKNYLILIERDPELSYEQIEGVATRRANWAYNELKCFLRIVQQEEIDPLEIYGSYAGAIGMAQFIPSTYLAYAQNQKGLEHWLLDKEAAIFSIGHYLKSNGWKRNLTTEKKRKVLWYYNHSAPYVETILRIAQKIKTR